MLVNEYRDLVIKSHEYSLNQTLIKDLEVALYGKMLDKPRGLMKVIAYEVIGNLVHKLFKPH